MTKLRDTYREEIKTLILICRARGFNPRQTTAYVNQHLKQVNTGKVLSQSYISRTIQSAREEANSWLKNLTSGKSDYISMFKDIIESLHVEQNELWEIIDTKRESDAKNKEYVMIKAYSEITTINKTLWDLYKDIPLLMNNSTSKTIDNIVYEDTTSVYPEISTSARHTSERN